MHKRASRKEIGRGMEEEMILTDSLLQLIEISSRLRTYISYVPTPIPTHRRSLVRYDMDNAETNSKISGLV